MDQKSLIDKLIAEARSYVGVKWRHRGRSRFGIDCIGLVVKSTAAAGIEMRDRLDYSRTPWNDGLLRELEAHFGEAVPLDELQPGDIVAMIGEGQPEAGHVGVIAEHAGRLSLIHSYNTSANSVVCEHSIDDYWRSRFVAAFRPIK